MIGPFHPLSERVDQLEDHYRQLLRQRDDLLEHIKQQDAEIALLRSRVSQLESPPTSTITTKETNKP